jgi:stearoyl-CoA desaturase (delta-9 desaturase)
MPRFLIAVLVGLASCQLAIFVTSVYLHRALAHRAIKLRPGMRAACRVLVWLTTGIKPREWAAVHRRHHAFTDREGDPHSPVLEGFAAVQFGNVYFYRRAIRDGSTVERYARDLPPDRFDRLVFDKGWLGLGLGLGILFLGFWGAWELVAVAAAVHVISYLLLNAAVNAVGHRFGRRPFTGAAGLATNSQWLAWLVAGEGLHNNHHAAPTSARFAMHRREVDPGWWLILAARRLGLLTVRHSAPKFAPRRERAAVSA